MHRHTATREVGAVQEEQQNQQECEQEVTKEYGSARAYAQEVHNWSQSLRCWMAYHQMVASAWSSAQQWQQQQAVMAQQYALQQQAAQQAAANGNRPGITVRLNLTRIFRTIGAGVPGTSQTILVQQHTIPSFLRRIAAEAIDATILFLLKLAFVYLLVEFEFMELDQFERILTSEADLQTLIDVTQGLFNIELLCKLFAAFIEAIYISFGVQGLPPGCTPGKWMLRMKVISCLDIQPVPGLPDRVAVTSLPSVSFRSSLLRSVLKNMLTTFLFPLSTAFYMFNHNRAIYDLAAKTLFTAAPMKRPSPTKSSSNSSAQSQNTGHSHNKRPTVGARLMNGGGGGGQQHGNWDNPQKQEVDTGQWRSNGQQQQKEQPSSSTGAKEQMPRGRQEFRGARNHDGPGPIPDRWQQYSVAIGNPLEGTRFLAFKTPLRPAFFETPEWEGGDEAQFEVHTVIEHIASLNQTLGLVIDLTNTDRYYDARLWACHQVEYLKIRCPGHEVNGDERFYKIFYNAVSRFFAENSDNDKLIGVHCTHGLNRTGYLICRYLIENQQWTAERAIEAFNQARGYPMERRAYIDSLHSIEQKMAALKVKRAEPKEEGEISDSD